MRLFFFIAIFMLFLGFIASAYAQPRQSAVSVKIHSEKAVSRTGLRIKFIELMEDSRCPTDTNCVWAGNAKLKIQVRSGKNQTESFELNSLTEPKVVRFGDYEIRLAKLIPNPRSNIRINRNGYIATFSVRRVGK